MRTLAIGDIHGCLTALETLLVAVDLREDDLLITLQAISKVTLEQLSSKTWVQQKN
jgi:hypothetical protein